MEAARDTDAVALRGIRRRALVAGPPPPRARPVRVSLAVAALALAALMPSCRLSEAPPATLPPAAAQEGGEAEREVARLRHRAAGLRDGGELEGALRETRRAYALARRHRLPIPALLAAADAGHVCQVAGRLGEAERWYRSAWHLAARSGGRRHRALVLGGLGRVAWLRGRPQEAVDLLRAAAVLWRQEREPAAAAVTLAGLADVYLELGAVEHAGSVLAAAGAAATHAGDDGLPVHLAARLEEARGWHLLRGGDLRAAGDALYRAAELSRHRARVRSRRVALDGRARVFALQGDLGAARGLVAEAAAGEGAGPAPRAAWRAGRGRLDLLAGRPAEAAGELRWALALAGEGEPARAAAWRHLLARALGQAGDGAAATAQVRAAAAAVEALRGGLRHPELRQSLLADRRSYAELWIDLLLADAASPAAAAAALEVSETARDRALAEALSTPAGAPPPPAAEARLRRLERDLAAPWAPAAGGTDGRRGGGDGDADALLWQWHAVASGTGAAAGGGALVAPPSAAPPAWRVAQALALDGRVVLVYWLGEARGWVWCLGEAGWRVRPLPPRGEVEGVVRRLHGSLARGPSRLAELQLEADARRLSEVLLAPVADALVPAGTLVVVTDGVLQGLPFALLPDPRRPRRPLVEDQALVVVPSLAVAHRLLRRAAAAPPRQGVLLLADPLPAAGAAGVPLALLPPLPGARREAAALAALAAAGGATPLRAFTGPELRRGLFAGGAPALQRPGGWHLVQVATHALAVPRRPWLSGLVLSGTGGYLPAYEVAGLPLHTDLAVLSACSTAGGGGEPATAVMGLVRAFLLAGADRAVASLWDVDDEATAVLMEGFHRALLVDRLAPESALARAQAAMARDERWSSPTHWAAFVLVGAPC